MHSTTGERWASARTLRLFCGEDADGDRPTVSANQTLTEFFAAYVAPLCLEPKAPKPRNWKQYRETLRFWADATGDPPLAAVDDFTAAQFLAALRERPGRKAGSKMASNTIRKHVTAIQFILDRAGARGPHNRKGAGLLDAVPYVDRPALQLKPPEDSFTLEEIATILEACKSRRHPRIDSIPPPVYWRSLILTAANTGLRIDAIMRLRFDMLEADSLNLPSEIIKGQRAQRLHLNTPARQAIEAMRGQRDLVFPWPGWPETQGNLQKHRRAIMHAAGIPEARQFGFHGFRKAFLTQLAQISPLAAQLAGGHANWSTTQRHYIHPRLLADAIEQLPQPPASA